KVRDRDWNRRRIQDLFSPRTEALGGGAVVLEVARGPKHAAGHKVEVTRVFHRRVVVTDGRAEDARVLRTVMVHPRHDKIIRLRSTVLLFYNLLAARDLAGRVEHMHVVIVLFVDRGPIS